MFESGMNIKPPTTQLEVKTLLNRIQHFVGFVYHSIRLRGSGGSLRVEVKIQPHRGIRGKCSTCQQPCPGVTVHRVNGIMCEELPSFGE